MWPLLALGIAIVALLVLWALSGWLGRPPGSVSVCLVVRDQEAAVEGLVGEVLAWTSTLHPHVCDVLVVDDASVDGTPEVLARLARRHPALKILRWPDDTTDEASALEAARMHAAGSWMLVRQVPAAGRPGASAPGRAARPASP
jgi:hypothetical protein